jgi:HAD superfamily phosphatase (TIGR01668 family)
MQKNIRFLIFDLDNTLAPYEVSRPQAKVVALMKRLQRTGFKICLLTNNTEKRMKPFNEYLGVPAVHGAMKPLTAGVTRAMNEIGAVREETAIIGDQLFSDVWAGKLAKLTTILVKPVSKKDIITVRWKRYFERPLIKSYYKKESNEKKS